MLRIFRNDGRHGAGLSTLYKLTALLSGELHAAERYRSFARPPETVNLADLNIGK